jgi:hypothetical protein
MAHGASSLPSSDVGQDFKPDSFLQQTLAQGMRVNPVVTASRCLSKAGVVRMSWRQAWSLTA